MIFFYFRKIIIRKKGIKCSSSSSPLFYLLARRMNEPSDSEPAYNTRRASKQQPVGKLLLNLLEKEPKPKHRFEDCKLFQPDDDNLDPSEGKIPTT